VDKVRCRRRSPRERERARGGGLDPVMAGHHCQQGQATQVDRRRGAKVEEHGVRLGRSTVLAPIIPRRNRTLLSVGPSRLHGPQAGPLLWSMA
jgi:hypothetical protein